MIIVLFLCIGVVSASEIASAPVASFDSDVVSGKVPLEVRFTDDSSGEPASWLWDFGDGSTSNLQDPAHTYTAAGTYTVSLTVGNANGSHSLTRTAYISADTRPVVAIDYIRPNPAIRGEIVSLVGLYVYNHTAIPSKKGHEWYSDIDGLQCTGRTLYTGGLSVGNHKMSFRAVDSEGQWSDRVYGYLVILENSLPIATIDSITPNHARTGQNIVFSGTGIDPDGKNVSYQWWSSIDNMLSNQSSFSRSNLSVGTHTIEFRVKDHMSWSKAVATVVVEGNTAYMKVSSAKAISVNKPVNIKVDISGIDYASSRFSVTDGTGAAVFERNITDDLVSGVYAFDWYTTDQDGELLPSGTYKLNLLTKTVSGDSISEEIGVTVDNTAPSILISDVSGISGSEKLVYANSGLLVKVSESGTSGDVATVSVELLSGSGIVKTATAYLEDGSWLAEFDLSKVAEGNYTLRAVAKDTAKNSNSIESDHIVSVDRTAPVIFSFTPADGHAFAEDTAYADIRFNYSDARTGINGSSIVLMFDGVDVTDSSNATITDSYASYNATGLTKGVHSASVYVEDNTGNLQIFTTRFWIGPKPAQAPTSTGRSSGSSGGGGGTTGEKYENVAVKEVQGIFVNAGSRVSYEFSKDGNAITSVRFDALKNSGKVQAIVETLKGRSSFAKADAPGNVYQQMNIWVGSTGFVNPENVENLFIGFKVEKSWLEDNDADAASVKLYRYADSSWNALSTSFAGEDDTYIYFESRTPGFSPFAIVSESTSTEATDALLRSADDAGTDVVTDDEAGTGSADTAISGSILVLAAICVVIAVAYVLYRKRS
ncbi:PGF-pre-PGF domain-containing protein [Methanolobus chelungpuianus]|uniref:PGF-pre-PGF domain-containing protein n=1 Tax=Methanolobus chelungpuianus TaxID=502115 RepID=UPI002114D14C|nr:PGF-pre-PGF domain-containing protein [Methanolobus chelungpuianus]